VKRKTTVIFAYWWSFKAQFGAQSCRQADGPALISPFTRNCRPGFIIHGQPARLSVNSLYMAWFALNSKTTSEVEKGFKILKRCTWSKQFCEFTPMYNVTVNTSKNAVLLTRGYSSQILNLFYRSYILSLINFRFIKDLYGR